MNFDFSDDLKQLREQARQFLQEHSSPKAVRPATRHSEIETPTHKPWL